MKFTLFDGEFGPLPHDNDNDKLLPDWMTPAEFFQWIRGEKRRMRKMLAEDFRLRTCPKFQREWEITLGMEKCGLSQLRDQK